jgi:hypothetical protein
MFENYQTLYRDMDLEFSVADDGSPEAAVAPVEARAVITHLPKKTKPLNPCVAINRAVAASHGNIIVLTNPEIEHRVPALRAVVQALVGPNDYVTAACYEEKRKFWLAGPAVNYSTHGRLPVPPGAHFHFLAAFSRSLWDRAGGFDEDFRNGTACDDNDWLWRAYRAGAVFKSIADTVWHHPSQLHWGMPFNGSLFEKKWPAAYRAELVQLRGTE